MSDKVLYNISIMPGTVWVFYLFGEELEAYCCDDPHDDILKFDSYFMEVWQT